MTGHILASPAKINLCLHVTGRRENGYHDLDSLVTFCTGDSVRMEAAEEDFCGFTPVTPDQMAGEDWRDNLAFRALQAFRQEVGEDRNWRILITKTLPIGGGVGGGSSNAAAVLRFLADRRGLEHDSEVMRGIALSLGADVPACLVQRNLRLTGIGEHLDPIEMDFPVGHVLLASPGRPLATPAVFRALELEGCHGPLTLPQDGWHSVAELADWLKAETHNDLTRPALSLCPQIGELLELMGGLDHARIARLTGSGATCFALFDEEGEADRAAATLRDSAVPWVMVSRFGDYA